MYRIVGKCMYQTNRKILGLLGHTDSIFFKGALEFRKYNWSMLDTDVYELPVFHTCAQSVQCFISFSSLFINVTSVSSPIFHVNIDFMPLIYGYTFKNIRNLV